jgi:hypothetical protein
MRSALLALVFMLIAGGALGDVHVLIGVLAEISFMVSVNGEEIAESPALSSPGGILHFETGPDSGLSTVTVERNVRPAAVCLEIPR